MGKDAKRKKREDDSMISGADENAAAKGPLQLEDISPEERRYLLNGSCFRNSEEKIEFMSEEGSAFDWRLRQLPTKREEHCRKVLMRFQGDLDATTDRWNLKAPPLDLNY